MASWHRVGPYESVALMEAKAESARKKLQKKNPNIRPVILQGRVIAHRWWGKAWCHNLERYAEYAPCVDPGRRYVRYGAVLDLQITAGLVVALVQGSRERPYKVQIHIDRIGPTDWRPLRQACEGRIASRQALLAGEFPKALGDLFMRQGQGLFPLPEEVHFECTCPEGTGLCKHLLAVLYGVGARLDEAPELLFLLRQVKAEDLVRPAAAGLNHPDTDPEAPAPVKAIAEHRRKPAKTADPAPSLPKRSKSEPPAAVPARRRRIVVTPPPAPVAAAEAPKIKNNQRAARAKSGLSSSAEKIVALIRQSAQGIDTETLQRRTGLAVAVIRSAVYAALRKGLIRRVGWGLYKGV